MEDLYLKDTESGLILKSYYELTLPLNQQRTQEVKQITVTLKSGVVLNGDETSQTRMSRAVTALPEADSTITWIDADGNSQELTKAQLQEALLLAGQKQTEIWTKYAQKKAELKAELEAQQA